MNKTIDILLVEDSPTDVLLTEEALASGRFTIQFSQRLSDALRLVQAHDFDVILLDLGLPDSQGIETLRRLRGTNPQIAVVVLTGKDDEILAYQALQEGAQDYLVKGELESHSLRRSIRYAVERTTSEKNLRRSEARVHELTANLNQALWMIDVTSARVLYVSRGYELLFGRTCQSLIENPESYMEGVHPDDRARVMEEDAAMYISGRIDMDFRIIRQDGSIRWVWVRGEPVFEDGKLARVVGVIEDITERRSLEAQLQQSQKMEAVGLLAGGVAHDFNNLLTIIAGYCEILLGRIKPDDPLHRPIKAINDAGNRAASLTRQLLAFSRKTVLEPRVVDLNDIVRETQSLLNRVIGEDIELNARLDSTIGKIKVDPGQLGQILMNLAVNARDAMPGGGKLTIETYGIELDADYARLKPDVAAGSYALLALSDTGIGMTLEVRARIFEPFFTTKGVGQGTGLGLSVVLGVVKQSGGHIEVYSEVGLGTTFKLYFPIVGGDADARSESSDRPDVNGVETILVVEDEDGVRELAQIALESFGYKVLTAANGKAALKLVTNHKQAIDLLLTDVVMPGIYGPDLAQTLVTFYPSIKVLFTSGYTDDAVVRHGLLEGNVDFIRKPYTPQSLARKVREVLDSKPPHG